MSWVSGNRYLSMEEMENNATEIWNFFGSRGWTIESVSAMLGNMQTESTINPAIWQSLRPWGSADKHGYGLTQWTPYTKITNWLTSQGYHIASGYGQCMRIQWEMENNQQWIATSTYNFSFREFSESTESPYTLALAFLRNYERPEDINQPIRGTQAEYWYTFLSGKEPIPPDPEPTNKQNKLPVWAYCRIF